MKTLPDTIKATRIINYDGASIAEAFDDDEQTLANVIDLAIDHAVEDLNNSTLNFFIEAEWLDDNGDVVKTQEFDTAGNLVRGHGVLVATPESLKKELTFHPYTAEPIRLSEFTIELGSGYDDPDVEYAYICSVANTIKTMHVVAVNEENRPVFKVLDDEGIIIEPSYKTLQLAITVAKGWLS